MPNPITGPTNSLALYLGWDSREAAAYHVAAHSVTTRASHPVSITPLVQEQLRNAGVYTRERGATEATEFSMTRFLVPYLNQYTGFSIFADCDILCTTNIYTMLDTIPVDAPLWNGQETRTTLGNVMRHTAAFRYEHVRFADNKAVYVVPHEYVPRSVTKMDGQQQTSYPRKNWSSVMVFDNASCRVLTPGYVSTATGLALHRFQWLEDEQLGYLNLEWNWLVGEYGYRDGSWFAPVGDLTFHTDETPKLLHYTLGGPWMAGYENCDHADLWNAERERMLS